MKKFKDFFDKKQSEMKFKMAGTGHKLSGASSASSSSTSAHSHSQPVPPQARKAGPDQNVAKAALARFENKTTPKSNLTNIMNEEKHKILQEMKLKEELEERKKNATKPASNSDGLTEFDKSQRFVCPSLDKNCPQTFEELMMSIKSSIYDNFAEDPILRSLMCLFNCNRTIDQSNSRVKACVEILEKIIKNLLTDNPEELEKFKRIRKSKIEQKVLTLDGALDFLFAIGFSNDSSGDWLIYEAGDDNIQDRMLYFIDLLENPQIIPIELDRQVRYLTPDDFERVEDNVADLNLNSSDVKKIYNNLERTREINEMFASKETKNNLLANRSANAKSLFTRLRFKFTLALGEPAQMVEATFYVSETLNDVRTWFIGAFVDSLPDKHGVNFRNGPTLLDEKQGTSSLAELQLTPAATLLALIV